MTIVRMTCALGLLLPATALAARLSATGVSASSSFPPEDGVTYEPEKIMDGKLSTSWVEGDQGSGLGSWIELDLGGERTVQKIRVWGGLWYSADYWKRANRPKDIEIAWSDGTSDVLTLKDEMKVQEFTLAKARKTTVAKIKVKSVYNGSTWLDTAFSEIQLFDAESDAHVHPRAVSASSNLPADADGNYDPMNVADGIVDSMWCEGSKAGDGSGEHLEFTFGGSQPVSKVTLVNGIGTSMPYWMKGNRAGTATLKFSDGSTHEITLKNSIFPQTHEFPAKTTSSVRMTFGAVVKGKEYNDLCISEAYFAN